MSDQESREQEARDIHQEAAEAGVPPLAYLRGLGDPEWAGYAECRYSGYTVKRCQASLCDCFDNGGNNPERGALHPEAFTVNGVRGSVLACPECQQGKHGNCDGTTWDVVLDGPVPCPCEDRAHGSLDEAGHE